jgi:hypothetical protein
MGPFCNLPNHRHQWNLTKTATQRWKVRKADAGSRLLPLEYAGCICLSGALVMAVGAILHLPGFAGFAVEKACKFLVKRTGVRIERFKFIFTHRAISFNFRSFLKHKMGMGDVKKA